MGSTPILTSCRYLLLSVLSFLIEEVHHILCFAQEREIFVSCEECILSSLYSISYRYTPFSHHTMFSASLPISPFRSYTFVLHIGEIRFKQ
ncbi:hypothetical protein F4825DRAFT_369282 [Nemania diffusa]|nr:hypothetical protein F4825DRAFT_369282 [Nemania diffusa]